jgi:hypothetical protein
MMAFSTADNWAWYLTVTDPNTTDDTYANTATNARDSAVALLVWLNQVGRPWYGSGLTFYTTWARDDYGGAVLTLGATAPFELDGGAYATLALDADTYYINPYRAVGLAAAAGTWWPKVPASVRSYARHTASGDASASGATRPGAPGLGHYLPAVEAIATATEAARLSAVLADCTTPRVVTVEQEHTGGWLSLAVGDVQRSRQGMAYRIRFDAAGAPV